MPSRNFSKIDSRRYPYLHLSRANCADLAGRLGQLRRVPYDTLDGFRCGWSVIDQLHTFASPEQSILSANTRGGRRLIA
jgi:hypothetical protein